MHAVTPIPAAYSLLGLFNPLDAHIVRRAGVTAFRIGAAMSSMFGRWAGGSIDQRWRLPVPPEMRERQPFLADVGSGRLIAPWPRNKPAPGDLERLDAMLAMIDRMDIAELSPSLVFWCRPHAVAKRAMLPASRCRACCVFARGHNRRRARVSPLYALRTRWGRWRYGLATRTASTSSW
jgi:hypothetical protein